MPGLLEKQRDCVVGVARIRRQGYRGSKRQMVQVPGLGEHSGSYSVGGDMRVLSTGGM